MTPQSELTRLLGIPPELWEVELKGMSDEMLTDLVIEAVRWQHFIDNLIPLIPKDKVIDISLRVTNHFAKEST